MGENTIILHGKDHRLRWSFLLSLHWHSPGKEEMLK